MSLMEMEYERELNPVDMIEFVAANNDWSFERSGEDEIAIERRAGDDRRIQPVEPEGGRGGIGDGRHLRNGTSGRRFRQVPENASIRSSFQNPMSWTAYQY